LPSRSGKNANKCRVISTVATASIISAIGSRTSSSIASSGGGIFGHMGKLGIVGVLLLSACGGSAGDGAPLSPGDAATQCADLCAHELSCGWVADEAACTTDCEGQSGLFRGAGYSDWMRCLTEASCDGQNPGEACYVQTAGSLDPRDVHDEYVSRCNAVSETCADITLPANVCDLDQVILFSDDYMTTSVLPCFDLACAQIGSCLEDAVLDAF